LAFLARRALSRACAHLREILTRRDVFTAVPFALGAKKAASCAASAVVLIDASSRAASVAQAFLAAGAQRTADAGNTGLVLAELTFVAVVPVAARILQNTGAAAVLLAAGAGALPVLACLAGSARALLVRATAVLRNAGVLAEPRPALAVADAGLTRPLKAAIVIATARRGTNARAGLTDPVRTAVGAFGLGLALALLALLTDRAALALLLFLFTLLGNRVPRTEQSGEGSGQEEAGEAAGNTTPRRSVSH
jgi:hypothetical protein